MMDEKKREKIFPFEFTPEGMCQYYASRGLSLSLSLSLSPSLSLSASIANVSLIYFVLSPSKAFG